MLAMATTETKIRIPHTFAAECEIVGVLSSSRPTNEDGPPSRRKIALVRPSA